jgi:hypothetical protein
MTDGVTFVLGKLIRNIVRAIWRAIRSRVTPLEKTK